MCGCLLVGVILHGDRVELGRPVHPAGWPIPTCWTNSLGDELVRLGAIHQGVSSCICILLPILLLGPLYNVVQR